MAKLMDWSWLQENLSVADFKEVYDLIQSKLNKASNKEYTPVLLLERGFGREYRNLEVVVAANLQEAEVQAEVLALKYIGQPGYEKAVIKEIRLRPANARK